MPLVGEFGTVKVERKQQHDMALKVVAAGMEETETPETHRKFWSVVFFGGEFHTP